MKWQPCWRTMLLVVLFPAVLWAGDAALHPALLPPSGEFVLTVDGPLLSLRATEAPITAVLEALGRRLGIDVVARLAPDQTLTLAFERLALADALERLRAYVNIVYVTDAREAPATIRRIMAIPIQGGEEPGVATSPVRAEGTHVDPLRSTAPRPFNLPLTPRSTWRRDSKALCGRHRQRGGRA